MKNYLLVSVLVSTGFLSGCSGKKSAPPVENQMSSKYTLDNYYDVNNVSTYDPELLKDLPKTVDLKEFMTPVKDQGGRGTCSFFTATGLYEAAVKKKMKVEVNFSEEYMNHSVKSKGYEDRNEGGSTLVNLHATQTDGLMLERDVPYQPSWFEWKAPCEDFKTDDESAPKVCYTHNPPSDEMLMNKIPMDNFEVWQLVADDFKEIITTLAVEKTPMHISIPIHPDSMLDNGEYSYTEEMRAECISGAASCGGHAVILTGYDLTKEVFYFRNSWSKKWGKNGYGQIPFSVVDRHVKHTFGYVVLTDKIKLPTDHAVDYLKLTKFEVNSSESADNAIEIKSKVSAERVGSHALVVWSKLAKRKNQKDEALSQTNTDLVELNKEEQQTHKRKTISSASIIFQDKEAGNVSWGFEDNVIMLGSKGMNIPSVAKLRADKNEQLVVSTYIYVYSDDEEYKQLKFITHPLNYVHYEY